MTARTFFSVVLVLGLSSLAIPTSPSSAQEALSAEQLSKAREELLIDFGATARAELEAGNYIMPGERTEDAKLGEPYAFYRIESECIQKLTDYKFFKQCLTFCLWDMPVSFGGKARFLLSPYNRDGEWHLARYATYPVFFIEDARSRWPKSEGHTVSYLRGARGMDFIMVEKGNKMGLCSFREGNDKVLGITKDQSGHYPLLSIPYVMKKLQARPDMRLDPKME